MSVLTLAEWAAARAEECARWAERQPHIDGAKRLFDDASYYNAVLTMLADRDRLEALINTPELEDFAKAVKIEAAHQRERWGEKHDISKSPHDWAAVLVSLLGKAINAAWAGDAAKFKHHIITIAATCNNWHARILEQERVG